MKPPDTLIQDITTAFATVPHPGSEEQMFDLELPCCADHDSMAKWFSQHTWQDFETEFRDGGTATEFGSLRPAAYQYFLPAILIFMLKNAHGSYESEARAWLRVVTFSYEFNEQPEEVERLRREVLPLFPSEQRRVVISCLQYLAGLPAPEPDRAGWPADVKEIERAIKEFWDKDDI